ncbi:MAG TPA: AAA family ATPase [Candidatus Sulfotelmatobacter sp.]|jgi:wobble nucleotide-excising tRNase|nr:AAA family ATPase [Candidatus Sulfotelmatobacter sp.]
MKIKKFDEINNTFSYSFFNWDAINSHSFTDRFGTVHSFDGSLVKSNIFFAENGSGKSNVIKIIKSLNGQTIVLGKHWDNTTEVKIIKVTLDDGTNVNYTNNVWDSALLNEKFIIFDKSYIEKFVYSFSSNSTDTPQIRQQRGKNIVYLGDFAQYQKEIDRINNLKDEISTKNNNFLQVERVAIEIVLRDKNITIAVLELEKDDILNLKSEELEDKQDKLQKKKEELEKIEKSLKEKNKINNLVLLSDTNDNLAIEEDFNPDSLFNFTVSKGLQETLHKISHKKGFIMEGLKQLGEGSKFCPFCEQSIANQNYIQIIKDYKTVFDETFSNEEKRIRQLLTKYKNVLENLRDLRAPVENNNRLSEIRQFLNIDENFMELILTDNKKNTIKTEIRLIEGKQSNLLDKIQGSQYDVIKKNIEEAKQNIVEYNKTVKKINDMTLQLRKDLDDGKLKERKESIAKEITNLDKEIFYIEKKDIFIKYFASLEKYKENNKTIESLERIYQSLKIKIVEKFNTFVTEYFELIKNFIKEISPAMDILQVDGESTLDRRNSQDSAQCGFKVKYNGEDCMDGLSEGEKQVIALAFFFAQLRKDNDKNKIIILDDPITSFDAGKRKSTAELIHRETQAFDQLFLFTCDPLFREYCLKQISSDRNFYYIFKTKGSSSIHYVPRNKETIFSSFEADFNNIDTILGSDENIVIYGQKLRFCLETKIKEEYLGYSEDNLSGIINKVASSTMDLTKLISNKDAILQIYSYCNTGGLAHYPRDGATSWTELVEKIKQYLNMDL